MKNILSDSTSKLVGKKKRSNKFFLILILVAILLYFSSLSINQYSFVFAGGKGGTLITEINQSFFSWWDAITGKEDTGSFEKEREALLQENTALKEQIRKENIKFTNEKLDSTHNLVELRVIGKDNFLDTPLLFLLGGNDRGLRIGLPVLNNQGSLIGTIKSSEQKISQVILTPNHDSRIGARLAGTDWDGVVEGNRDLRAVLEMLSLDSQLKVGDQVVTDNRNPDIPEGILLGTVSFVKESDDHLFKEAVLDLPWDSKKLDKVWVVTGRK